MAEMVFAAHDPGGALMLEATRNAAQLRGHELRFVGSGPAASIWRRVGLEVCEVGPGSPYDKMVALPDLVVTGSGFGDFERNFWKWAQTRDCPTMAVIDSWTNMGRRFQVEGGFDFPHAIAVVDEDARSRLIADSGCDVPIFVTGQAHLQQQTARLSQRRAMKLGVIDIPHLVFFSEPIDIDYGSKVRGFDQYEVFEQLCGVLDLQQTMHLEVKPHPRESWDRWQQLISNHKTTNNHRITITEAPADELLVTIDGVLGMTSMVLLEAHLLGIPVLSLQPGRTSVVNAVLEDNMRPVLHNGGMAASMVRFLDCLGTKSPVSPRTAKFLHDADKRTVAAIETLIRN